MSLSHKSSQLALKGVSIPIEPGSTLFHFDHHAYDHTGTIRPLGVYPDIEEGLVGYWDFSKEQEVAYDLSGNDNHGTIVGATWGNGRNGKALSFDGIDDYVAITNISPITLSEFTLSAWVKITSHKLNYFLNFNINGALSSLPVLYSVADGRFGYWEGTNNYFGEASLDTWYLLSVVRTSTEFSLYVNGGLESVVAGSYSPITLSQLYLGEIFIFKWITL